jgi:MFS family permease
VPDLKPRHDRLFWILIAAAITAFGSGAVLGTVWQVIAATAPEPRWMARVTAAGMLGSLFLAAMAGGILLWRRRHPDA